MTTNLRLMCVLAHPDDESMGFGGTRANWEQVWEAVSCHRTQLPCYQALLELSADHHRYVWGTQEYYRVFSLVNSGRAIERDLFEGLRRQASPLELAGSTARTLAA